MAGEVKKEMLHIINLNIKNTIVKTLKIPFLFLVLLAVSCKPHQPDISYTGTIPTDTISQTQIDYNKIIEDSIQYN